MKKGECSHGRGWGVVCGDSRRLMTTARRRRGPVVLGCGEESEGDGRGRRLCRMLLLWKSYELDMR